jgi:hypothetical protein
VSSDRQVQVSELVSPFSFFTVDVLIYCLLVFVREGKRGTMIPMCAFVFSLKEVNKSPVPIFHS